MKKIKYAKKNLMLLHDGNLWHARVRRDNGAYKFMSSEKMDDVTIPEEIIQWGIQNGASTLRVLLTRELNDYILEDAAPHLMPADELYETLASLIAEKTGLEFEEIAPSIVTDTDLGTQNNGKLWGSAIEQQHISNYLEICRKEGINFEGATTVQIAAMLENSKNAQGKNLIFLGEKDSFAYASTISDIVPEYKYIPMAAPNSSVGEEYYRRLLRRIQPFLSKPIRLICPDNRLDDTKKIFETLPNIDVEYFKLSEIKSEIMQVVADAHTYLLDKSAGLISVAPKKKDAKFTGSVICFTAITLSILILGSLWAYRNYEVSYWTDLKAKVTALTSAQKSAQGEFDTAKNKLEEMRSLINSLNKMPPKTTDNYLDILCLVAETIPATSWITDIYQENGKTIIKGKTIHLKTQSDFVLNLNKELFKYRKEAIPRKIVIDTKVEENTFEIEIANQ